MNKQWVLREPAPSGRKIEELRDAFRQSPHNTELNSYLAELLLRKGIDSIDSAKLYINPSLQQLHNPFLMKGMERAVNRILKALSTDETILVYGDYDVDGATSVALMYAYLKRFHSKVYPYIPNRFTEGYGISDQGVSYAANAGAGLIIALDCGIKAFDKVAEAKLRGIDMIICDHHTPGDGGVPAAHAVLDPKQVDCAYPFKELSGCGIGYKIIQALTAVMDRSYRLPNQYLDLVAVSIASDIVPMLDENRVLAHWGLKKLDEKPLPGIKALKAVAGVNNCPGMQDIVFKLGPRLNAAGRMGSALDAFRLLASYDDTEAATLASRINEINHERKAVDENISRDAMEMVEENSVLQNREALVLFNKEWHKGIIGIVASRIVEKFYKPAVLLTKSNGLLTGSARSIPGFDLYDAVNECSHYLEAFGGHKAAAGLSLKEENLESFTLAFEAAVKKRMTDELKVPKIMYDLDLPIEAISANFGRSVDKLGPFGPDNMQPVFVSREVELSRQPRRVGVDHLKLFLKHPVSDISAIGFNMAHFLNNFDKDQRFDLCYSIEPNHFNGKLRYELYLKDIKLKTSS